MRQTSWWLPSAVLVGSLMLLAATQSSKIYAQGSPYGPWYETFPGDPMGDNNPHNYYGGRGYNAPYAYGASQGVNIFPYYGEGYYGARADSPYRAGYFTPEAYAPYLYGHLGGCYDHHCGVGWW
jgi:hypothetical protein